MTKSNLCKFYSLKNGYKNSAKTYLCRCFLLSCVILQYMIKASLNLKHNNEFKNFKNFISTGIFRQEKTVSDLKPLNNLMSFLK